MRKELLRSYRNWLPWLIFVLVLIPRFLYLDQDVPAYMISGLSQEDEPYYCLGALNKVLAEEGRIVKDFEKVTTTGLQLFITPLSYFSFKLFGNNYFGLRIPNVIFSCVILLLIFLIIRKRVAGFYQQIFLLMFFACDFYFFLFSRFSNPQLHSIFFIGLISFVYLKPINDQKIKFGLLGFLAVFLIGAVYIYNVFIIAGISVTTLVFAIKRKEYLSLLWLTLGGLLAIVLIYLGLLYYDVSFSSIYNLLFKATVLRDEVQEGSKRISYLMGLLYTFLQFASTNFIRYNLSYLLLTAVGLFIVIKDQRLLKDEFVVFFVVSIVALIFQSLFVVSYPFKKHISAVILMIFFLVYIWENIMAFNYYMLSKLHKIIFITVLIIAFLAIVYNVKVNNSMSYWSSFNYGYYENISLKHILINVTVILFIIVTLFIKKGAPIKFVTGLLCFPGVLLIINYCFAERTYLTRDGIKSVRSKYENKAFIEGFTHSFQFYSGVIPGPNAYDRGLDFSDKMIEEAYELNQPSYQLIKYFNHEGYKDAKIGALIYVDNNCFTLDYKLKLKYYNFAILRFKGKYEKK